VEALAGLALALAAMGEREPAAAHAELAQRLARASGYRLPAAMAKLVTDR
jgi:hypothetical protein